MTTYWTRIDHGTAVGVRNGRGRFLRLHSDVNSRRPSKCLRSLAGRCAKHSLRIPASACAWFKCGSRISARRWRSFSGRPKRNPDPIKSRRKSEGQKVRTAITVSDPINFFSSYWPRILSRIQPLLFFNVHTTVPRFLILKFLFDPEREISTMLVLCIALCLSLVPINSNKF